MHYIDEGSGDTLVMLHGEPTWSFLYRKIVAELSPSFRVVAPDLIGFGRSDKVTDRAWYSYDRHCDAFGRFLEGTSLSGITLVVHDWGGPIGLRVAIENPGRVARLVILNTGLYRSGSTMSDAWKAFRAFVEATPDLPIGMLIQGATSRTLPNEVVAAYEAPFTDALSKSAAAAFPLLVPTGDEDPGASEMARTLERLSRWDKPALVLFSDSDPIFRATVGKRLASEIPGASFSVVRGASHFLQEDAPEEIAEQIARFCAST